jgi:hypothetical protein
VFPHRLDLKLLFEDLRAQDMMSWAVKALGPALKEDQSPPDSGHGRKPYDGHINSQGVKGA